MLCCFCGYTYLEKVCRCCKGIEYLKTQELSEEDYLKSIETININKANFRCLYCRLVSINRHKEKKEIVNNQLVETFRYFGEEMHRLLRL